MPAPETPDRHLTTWTRIWTATANSRWQISSANKRGWVRIKVFTGDKKGCEPANAPAVGHLSDIRKNSPNTRTNRKNSVQTTKSPPSVTKTPPSAAKTAHRPQKPRTRLQKARTGHPARSASEHQRRREERRQMLGVRLVRRSPRAKTDVRCSRPSVCRGRRRPGGKAVSCRMDHGGRRRGAYKIAVR